MRLFLSLLGSQLAVLLSNAAPQIKLGKTTLYGTYSAVSDGVEMFAGIPYAEPPIGRVRFMPTTLMATFSESRFNATQFGPGCLQQDAIVATSEDCLTINVFRPSNPCEESLPVMVFIHGGDFIEGAASMYDGSALVARSIERGTPMIYASINYRLGPFGFPQGREAIAKGSLNLGLKDQLLALQWVKKNIFAFGGDASKVTVFGESAGAHSVDIHILGSSLKDLARGAIIQSSYRDPQFDSLHWEPAWQTLVSAVPQCSHQANTADTFSCMKHVSNTTLLLETWAAASAQYGNLCFNPVIDGPGGLMEGLLSQVTPKSPLPVMIGSVKDEGGFLCYFFWQTGEPELCDEGTLFVPLETNSSDVIHDYIIVPSTPSPKGQDALEAAADRILELYPNDPSMGSPFGTGNETFGVGSQYKRYAAVLGDFAFEWHRRSFSQYMSAEAQVPTFVYKFQDPDASPPGGLGALFPPGSLGVCHASELAYMMPTSALGGSLNSTSAETLSTQMMDYWISFAVSLDPSDDLGSERPQWDDYSKSQMLMQLDGQNLTMIPDNYREEQIGFIMQDPVLFHR
ncbi:extracellular triacylglycerol lipase precursor [Mycena vulgaris]|nr:extracellular triacylglycerol lipase precursor [Mycena vulgaris]